MEGAEEELERRSKFLSSLILQKKNSNNNVNGGGGDPKKQEPHDNNKIKSSRSININNNKNKNSISVRASDMPLSLQNHAFKTTTHILHTMPNSPKIDTKHLALSLKKEFDTTFGPAWHCIVGTSFGSYVTHSIGGFLYFSIDKVYVLLFKTAVEPLDQ
ncbi:hypothetical protein ABFX02_05G043700 [Erythranthe guttata]